MNLWRTVNHSYACSLCRGHFHYIFNDATVQTELAAVGTREDAVLWTWKIHNAVTANNFPTWPAFPEGSAFDLERFRIPETRTQLVLAEMNATVRVAVISAVDKRWKISGGLDASKSTNDACPASSDSVVQLDLYVMGLCPFCRVTLKSIRSMLKCTIKCTTEVDAVGVSGMLDFRLHFVGAIDKKSKELMSLHGPNEVQVWRIAGTSLLRAHTHRTQTHCAFAWLCGLDSLLHGGQTDQLYLCAIKYYPKNYQVPPLRTHASVPSPQCTLQLPLLARRVRLHALHSVWFALATTFAWRGTAAPCACQRRLRLL